MLISEVGRQYLRLHLVEGVGAVRFRDVLARFKTIDRALGARAGELAQVKGIGPETAEAIAHARDRADLDAELALAERHKVRIRCLADEDYPETLRHLPDPPMVLYVLGQYQRDDAVAIAIVGSRRCTTYGREQAQRFGYLLAQAGLTVVSGLAYGVDSHAHRGALAAGGRTIAVQGRGLAQVYPPQNTDLANQIAERGAIISELPMRFEPLSGHFPPRNRIIAGLSLGVMVVEAATRSGALITARLANEYNREVFAVPGRVDNPYAMGANALIRDGHAKLVMDAEDVLGELGEVGQALRSEAPADSQPSAEATEPAPPVELSEEERRLSQAIDAQPRSPDELADLADLPVAKVLYNLTTLQLKGLIEQLPGMLFHRKGRASNRQ